MDNQSPDKNNQLVFAQNINKLFESRLSKALLFLGTLIFAVIIPIPFSGMGFSDIFDGSFVIYLLIFPSTIPVLLIVDLVNGGYMGDAAMIVLFLGGLLFWVVYIGIMAIGIGSRNLRTSKILFLVFVFLLLINVVGGIVDL